MLFWMSIFTTIIACLAWVFSKEKWTKKIQWVIPTSLICGAFAALLTAAVLGSLIPQNHLIRQNTETLASFGENGDGKKRLLLTDSRKRCLFFLQEGETLIPLHISPDKYLLVTILEEKRQDGTVTVLHYGPSSKWRRFGIFDKRLEYEFRVPRGSVSLSADWLIINYNNPLLK